MPSILLHALLVLPAILRVALAQTACNNSPRLCDRAYNNVTHLGAHDSPFIRDSSTDYSESGDQYYNSTVQLSAGVRLLTAQVHNTNSSDPSAGSWHLCHTSCDLLDAGTLTSWLSEIGTWLDGNPNEVVTVLLVNSDNANATEIAAQYSAAGIEHYAFTPNSTTRASSEWPTLQEMISNGTRLVNFVASLDPSSNTVAPYLLDEFTFIFENNYDNSAPTDFNCTANRPSNVDGDTASALSQDLMPFMNHFLYADQNLFGSTIEVPDDSYANVTNAPSGGTGNLGDAATQCSNEYGRAPTYILVDFFNVGPAISTVDRLNGVTSPVGRSNISTAAVTSSTSDAGRSGPMSAWLVYAFVSTLAMSLAL